MILIHMNVTPKEADNVYSIKEPYVNPPRRGIAFKRNLRSSIKGGKANELRAFETDTGTSNSVLFLHCFR